MATKKRIADLHATLTADVAAYDTAMKQAAASTEGLAVKIDTQFSEIQKSVDQSFSGLEKKTAASFAAIARQQQSLEGHSQKVARSMREEFAAAGAAISRSFSAGAIARSLLGGLGIGTAMQAVNLAVNYFVDKWKEGERLMAAAEERAKSIADIMRQAAQAGAERRFAKSSTEDQIAILQARADKIRADMAAAEAERERSVAGVAHAGAMPAMASMINWRGQQFGERGIYRAEFADLMQRQADEAQKEWASLNVELRKTEDQLGALQEAAMEQSVNNALAIVERGIAKRVKAETDALNAENEALTASVKAWAKNNAAIMEGQRSYAAWRRRQDAARKAAMPGEVDKSLTEFSGELDEESARNFKEMEDRARSFQRQMERMWENVGDRAAQTLADIALAGEASFGDLVNIVSRSMLEIVARMAVINPLMNAVFGFSGTSILPAFFGRGAIKTAASGNNFERGELGMVGENGPELRLFNRDSQVIPNTRSRQLLEGASGGGTYYIDARGADQAAIGRLEHMIAALHGSVERRAVAAVLGAKRRGGGLGGALAFA